MYRTSPRINPNGVTQVLLSDVLRHLKRTHGINNIAIVDLSCASINDSNNIGERALRCIKRNRQYGYGRSHKRKKTKRTKKRKKRTNTKKKNKKTRRLF